MITLVILLSFIVAVLLGLLATGIETLYNELNNLDFYCENKRHYYDSKTGKWLYTKIYGGRK